MNANPHIFTKLTLGAAGLISLIVGLTIAFAPHALFGSAGVSLPDNASLLSEIRTPGVFLIAIGGYLIFAALRGASLVVPLTVSVVLFGAYAAGRVLSFAADGMPAQSLLMAFGVEALIAGICLIALKTEKSRLAL
ncbi:DUF4345 domain-containing protein [Cognatishimia sp. SS12]|uniref:DUF4345 domain-containing protein n=1 Tax=Cognatishimia sp. SS12 TaxID=2979465 RepID=UPI00232D999D|nr:DUF4345 domain-containing protein [Cognatishimia sp. SS12]MDC0739055.1 DUF4345 domain-containing protein [Cognatishimia sp. SS12]